MGPLEAELEPRGSARGHNSQPRARGPPRLPRWHSPGCRENPNPNPSSPDPVTRVRGPGGGEAPGHRAVTVPVATPALGEAPRRPATLPWKLMSRTDSGHKGSAPAGGPRHPAKTKERQLRDSEARRADPAPADVEARTKTPLFSFLPQNRDQRRAKRHLRTRRPFTPAAGGAGRPCLPAPGGGGWALLPPRTAAPHCGPSRRRPPHPNMWDKAPGQKQPHAPHCTPSAAAWRPLETLHGRWSLRGVLVTGKGHSHVTAVTACGHSHLPASAGPLSLRPRGELHPSQVCVRETTRRAQGLRTWGSRDVPTQTRGLLYFFSS